MPWPKFWKMNVTQDYAQLSEDEKIESLNNLLNDPRPLTTPYQEYSDSTEECLEVYRTVSVRRNSA